MNLGQVWDNVTNKVSEHFERKKQEQLQFRKLQKQANWEQQIAMDQQSRQERLDEAKEEALRQAKRKKGIQRLRALNRLKRLDENPKNQLFSKLSQHTQRNLKRTTQNKRRNKMIKEEAKRMKKQRLQRKKLERLRKKTRN